MSKGTWRLLPWLGAALLCGWMLFHRPIHGMADNMDFWRVMEPAGISYSAPVVPLAHVTREFSFASPSPTSITTSAALPALLASAPARLVSPQFDIRFLSVLYFLLFFSGLALLCLSFGHWPFLLGIAWLAIEPSLFLHFNSFFSEAFAIALWPWMIWALLGVHRAGEKKHWLVLAASAFLLATSKFQFVLVPLLLLLGLRISSSPWRRPVSFSLLLAFAASLSFALATSGHRNLSLLNRYQSIFTGLSPLAHEPGQPLRALGIPEGYHYLSGGNLFAPPLNGNLPPDLRQAVEKTSFWRIGLLYLSTPGVLLHSLPALQSALAVTPLGYLGNYEAGAAPPRATLHFPWQLSRIRDAVFSFGPWLSWLIPALAAFLCFRMWRRQRRLDALHCLMLFLLFHFLSQLGVCLLGDGLYSLHRHLLSARFSLDLLLVLLLERGYQVKFKVS